LFCRSERVLKEYEFEERTSRLAAENEGVTLPVSPALIDRTVHVLELLGSLRVSPAVADAMDKLDVKRWVEHVRARRRTTAAAAAASGSTPGSGSASQQGPSAAEARREQTHLIPFYGWLCELTVSSDARVRSLVRQLLIAVGKELGLPSRQ
jgi:hypothetical protein